MKNQKFEFPAWMKKLNEPTSKEITEQDKVM